MNVEHVAIAVAAETNEVGEGGADEVEEAGIERQEIESVAADLSPLMGIDWVDSLALAAVGSTAVTTAAGIVLDLDYYSVVAESPADEVID